MHNTKTSGNGNRKEDMSKLSKLNIQLRIMFPEKKTKTVTFANTGVE